MKIKYSDYRGDTFFIMNKSTDKYGGKILICNKLMGDVSAWET
jgi:hypothetical protein